VGDLVSCYKNNTFQLVEIEAYHEYYKTMLTPD